MNREEIIRMAREAGYGLSLSDMHAPALERFAALVAAAEREKCYEFIEILIDAEREACADVAEQAGIEGHGTLAAAAMIRARGRK